MRRAARRYLPSFLLLLAPLVLLALVGAAELSRQSERAERLLQEQALALVSAAARQLEEALPGRVQELLAARDWLEAPLPRTADELARVPGVLDLILLDGDARLLYPEVPPGLDSTMPLGGGHNHALLLEAELLESLGDVDGACAALQELTSRVPAGTQLRGMRDFDGIVALARAQLQLGGLHRRAGRTEPAALAYREAARIAGELLRRPGARTRSPRDAASIRLLADVARAELDTSPQERLHVLQGICEGRHDALGDDLLGAVADRLVAGIDPAGEHATVIADLLQVDRTRRLGRRFASDYRRAVEEPLRLRLLEAEQPMSFQSHPGPEGTTLLAIQRAPFELVAAHNAGFAGLRIDVALFVNAEMDAFLTPDENGFFLGIFDADGKPLLRSDGSGETAAELPFELPAQVTLGGLELRAIAANPAAILDDRRASVRGRALLLIALCLTTIGAGFVMFRTIQRESEVASLKVEFVSRVSHELKTPLSLIRMYAETIGLGRTRSPAQTGEFASIIVRESDRLTAMIERILEFAGKETATLHYHREPHDLAALVHEITEQYRPQATAKGAELQVRAPSPLDVDVDAGALENALLNLLENAIKYTPADTAERTVVVELQRHGEDAVLAVHDRGIGIPAGEQEKVFEGFYRASNAGEVRGAGIGLSLVRHFARAHGGDAVARARAGGGATIELRLPLRGTNGASNGRSGQTPEIA